MIIITYFYTLDVKDRLLKRGFKIYQARNTKQTNAYFVCFN